MLYLAKSNLAGGMPKAGIAAGEASAAADFKPSAAIVPSPCNGCSNVQKALTWFNALTLFERVALVAGGVYLTRKLMRRR